MKIKCLPLASSTKKIAKTAIAATALSMCSMVNLAQAGIIDTNDNSFIDQETGLEWMDFGINNQYNFYQVVDLLAPGEIYDGWRLASESEVETLWLKSFFNNGADVQLDNRGVDATYYHATAENISDGSHYNSPWDIILDAMGYNYLFYPGEAQERTYALGLFENSDQGLSYAFVGDYTTDLESDVMQIAKPNTSRHIMASHTDITWATMLVRGESTSGNEVPEPTTLAILGLGLLGLVLRRNKLSR